jgi:hypothetical protein
MTQPTATTNRHTGIASIVALATGVMLTLATITVTIASPATIPL